MALKFKSPIEVNGTIKATSQATGEGEAVLLDSSSKVPSSFITLPSISAGDVSGLATVATSGSYSDLTNKPTIPVTGTTSGCVPVLDANGKLANSTIPPLAIGEVISWPAGTSDTKANLVTLSSAEKGDIAVVSSDSTTDNNGVYWLNGTYSTLADWVQIVGPGAVVSVNGKSGVVTLTASDVSALASSTTFATINGTSVKSNTAFTLQTPLTAGTDYQVPLVSGTNIKSINSSSILGSGNVDLATTNLNNVNVGSANADKFVKVKSDGTLEFAQPSITTYMTVTVTGEGTDMVGGTVTAVNGGTTVTGTTDGNGVAVLEITESGTYSISYAKSGVASGTASVTISSVGFNYPVSLAIVYRFKFSMDFNATTFQTDPTGCLTYADDCTGYTPVSGPGSNTLAKCSTIGDWVMNADGTSDNPLLDKCFYATFNSSGVLHEKLNPQDLTKKIATWDNVNKVWESASGSSSITSEDTMFCIPTIYLSSTATKITLSEDAASGTAYAHTIGGTTYDYLAIGVYETYNNGSVAQSWSGRASTAEVTRPTFRTYSTGKTIQNGHAMVWNFHQWNLWRMLTIFAMKSFDGQTKIGQGGFTYNGGVGQGLCNTMGPFAGNTSNSASTSTSVKAFIENPWGYKYEFIDDFYGDGTNYYVGQNAVPTDDTSNKTTISGFTAQGTPNAILTALPGWGLGTNSSGSSTTGLCDYQYVATSSGSYLGRVGGSSSSVSGGSAGPSCLGAYNGVSSSDAYYGVRLAFVFNI